eukprot:3000895-Prymnesium_polylepis.1
MPSAVSRAEWLPSPRLLVPMSTLTTSRLSAAMAGVISPFAMRQRRCCVWSPLVPSGSGTGQCAARGLERRAEGMTSSSPRG